jgi:chromosome segregation ATPase
VAGYGAGAATGAGDAGAGTRAAAEAGAGRRAGQAAPPASGQAAPESAGEGLAAQIAAIRTQGDADASADWSAAREYRSLRKKGETRLAKIEAGIDALEKRIASIEAEMSSDSAASDHVRLTALSSEHEEQARELDGLMRQWEALSSALSDPPPA